MPARKRTNPRVIVKTGRFFYLMLKIGEPASGKVKYIRETVRQVRFITQFPNLLGAEGLPEEVVELQVEYVAKIGLMSESQFRSAHSQLNEFFTQELVAAEEQGKRHALALPCTNIVTGVWIATMAMEHNIFKTATTAVVEKELRKLLGLLKALHEQNDILHGPTFDALFPDPWPCSLDALEKFDGCLNRLAGRAAHLLSEGVPAAKHVTKREYLVARQVDAAAAMLFKVIKGSRPVRRVGKLPPDGVRVERGTYGYGPYIDFLNRVYSILEIEAQANSIARQGSRTRRYTNGLQRKLPFSLLEEP